MKQLMIGLAIAGMAGGFGIAAQAASHGMDYSQMTCAEFTAMDAEAQMNAVKGMQMASDDMSSDNMASDNMESDSMASDDMAMQDSAAAIVAACEGNPDMMAMDAMMAGMDN
ncbi:MAG: HdeA/HdeB family chaperone [Paracoccaceae bacterium]